MKRLLLLFALAVGTTVAGSPAAAGPAPLRVDAVSPQVADRGELVTISGGGFGSGNLEVRVGGEPVELASATGSRASFRVPPLAPFGDVVVEARNPGGHVGRIGLSVRFDGRTEAIVDEATAASVEVGEGGGTIGVAGMTLAIPAGAAPAGTTITATPLLALEGSPFAATPVGLKLEPSGLVLLRPATLTLPKPQGEGAVVGFGFDGDGDELHLVPITVAGDTVQLKVWHFSGAGTLTAALSELNAVLSYETTREHGRAETRIAAALIAATSGSDPAQAIFDALADWRRSVSNGLQIAWDTGRVDFFELAFGEWQAWQAYVQEYRDTLSPEQGATLDAFIRVDSAVATEAAYAVGNQVLDRCVGPGVPRPALRDVLRLATAVVMAALPIEEANDPGERQLPSGDGLVRACVRVELLAFEHSPTFARNRDNEFTADARVSFWSGPSSTTIPLRYELRDATGGPSVPLASGTSATGSYTDTISPAGLGERHYELTAHLDTAGTDDVLRAFFDRQTDVVPVRERLDLQARRTGDAAFGDLVGAVSPGNTVHLRVRLAGDDVAGRLIEIAHDGSGSVAATTTTDANGEAFLTYVAPASAQVELVTATVSDGGLTSGDAVVITTVAPTPVGVSKVRNRAAVAAHCFGGPALDLLVSPPGATTFDEMLACAGEEGARSLASSFFRETISGGRVTGIDLRGVADVAAGTDPSGFGTAAGRYEIVFAADRPTSIAVSGSLSPCDPTAGKAELLLFSMSTGVVVARKTCTSPGFTAVLAPGQYILTVEAEAGSSEGNGRPTPTHSYAIQVAFTEP